MSMRQILTLRPARPEQNELLSLGIHASDVQAVVLRYSPGLHHWDCVFGHCFSFCIDEQAIIGGNQTKL